MRLRAALVALLVVFGCRDADIDQVVLIEVPATVPSIPVGTLHVALYRYDPLLMDAPATRVDLSVVPFTHRAGLRTTARARVRGRGVAGERFYLGVDGCMETPDGLRSVLWDGLEVALPPAVRMQPRAAPFPPCAGAIPD